MIIHSYLTNGFYPWAELFLESLEFHHGTEHKVVLSTRDLTKEQIENLITLYPNIEIRNEALDIESMSLKSNIPIEKLIKYKNEIESKCVFGPNVIWKQFISVEDRYKKSIIDVMNDYQHEDFMLHIDIDMYVRQPLDDLFEIIRNNDISIKFRLNSKDNRKVLGSLIGFRLEKKTLEFMNKWIYYIDKIPINEKPIGYGQTSFYYAYRDMKDNFDWGQFPTKFSSPHLRDNDVIRSGNTKYGKTKNLKMYREDFKCKKKQLKK